MSFNLDSTNLSAEVRNQIEAALATGTNESMVEAVTIMARSIETNILKEARSLQNESIQDYNVLMQRGQAQLTSEERSYYAAVQENRGFTNLDLTMPITIFDRVFEELEANHPLLSQIDFVNTTGLTKWLCSTPGTQAAKWGALNSTIVQELEANFYEIDATMNKLSAFIPVSKDMLDLGAVWIDKYVRALLNESIANALEEAIIKGNGKDCPIGMVMDLDGSVVSGVYPEKTPTVLADLKPATLGEKVMSPLTRDGKRVVSNVLMIVNPLDYWSKIFGLTTVLNAQGVYVKDVLAIPGNIVQSAHMPVGKMAVGLGKDYFAGVGTNAKIAFSDEYKFLEDQRVYAVKQHATGRPKDNKSFLYFDISTLGAKATRAARATTKEEETTEA